ncbi:hypothetical protein [uncultured Cocleimonas sp.]|uniref:hypothetical protein n=1 Tax=uncultured Cocleimonas sp. TaxID=1051587 RepID=UPI0026274D6D|nr:hypothetical protein [uncultured Cocleimonas sp.]
MKIKLTTLLVILLASFITTQSFAVSHNPAMAQLLSFTKSNGTLSYIKTTNLSGAGNLLKIDTRNGNIINNVSFYNNEKLETFAATPDGFKFLAKSAKGIAVIHNGTGKTLRTLPYPNGVRYWPITPVISYNTVYMAVPSTNHKIYFVHTGTGKILRTINLAISPKNAKNSTIITAMAFSPNSKVFAYQTQSNLKNTVHIYDINNQVELNAIPLTNAVKNNQTRMNQHALKFDGTGKQLISYTSSLPSNSVQLIDLNSQTVKTLKLGNFTFAGFSKNSRSIIAISPADRKITTADIQTGRLKNSGLGVHKISAALSNGVQSNITQSPDKSLIAVPFQSTTENKDGFLIIDSNSGNIIRNIH